MPQFVLTVPDSLVWLVDALSLPWEALDPYPFPPVAILGKVVAKIRDYPCRRIILIALGWPIMPWFCDLVAMASQIPLCLLNLLTQPFNLHTWILEPQQSRSNGLLWLLQHELRLLKEYHPDQSTK